MITLDDGTQITNYLSRTRRHPLAKPLIGYSHFLFRLPPDTDNRCGHVMVRIVCFLVTAPILFPLLSLVAFAGLPFAKKIVVVLPKKRQVPISPISSPITGLSPRSYHSTSDFGASLSSLSANSSAEANSALQNKKKILSACKQLFIQLKEKLFFDRCQQFGCLFQLKLGGKEQPFFSEIFLLRPAEQGDSLLKMDCEEKIKDIFKVLKNRDLSKENPDKRSIFSTATMVVKMEDRQFRCLHVKRSTAPGSTESLVMKEDDATVADPAQLIPKLQEYMREPGVKLDPDGYLSKV